MQLKSKILVLIEVKKDIQEKGRLLRKQSDLLIQTQRELEKDAERIQDVINSLDRLKTK